MRNRISGNLSTCTRINRVLDQSRFFFNSFSLLFLFHLFLFALYRLCTFHTFNSVQSFHCFSFNSSLFFYKFFENHSYISVQRGRYVINGQVLEARTLMQIVFVADTSSLAPEMVQMLNSICSVSSHTISIFCLMNIHECWFWTSSRHHHCLSVTFSFEGTKY